MWHSSYETPADILSSPPTFSAPPGQFVGMIAGGEHAIRNAVEGAEDSEVLAMNDLKELQPPLAEIDTVVGIASSGRTPYVIGGLKYAREIGAATVGVACVQPSALRGICDVLIECLTGPEVVTGSTRLKAGTATKMVRNEGPIPFEYERQSNSSQILNMISTGSQVRAGKTYGNLVSRYYPSQ